MRILCGMFLFLALSGCQDEPKPPGPVSREFDIAIENVSVHGIAKAADEVAAQKMKVETAILLSQ